MRLAWLLLVAGACAAGCSTGTLETPDLGADLGIPLDLATPALPATRIAPATTTTSCLAADATRAYWSDSTSGAPQIVAVPLAGGAAPTPLASGGDAGACVAISSDSAFYFDGDKLMKVPLSGGGPAVALASGQHLRDNTPLVVSGDRVYWLTETYGDVDAFSGKNALVSLATNASPGSKPTVINADIGINAAGLAVDATRFYYGDGGGLFARALATPTTATLVVKAALNPPAFAVGAGWVLVAEVTAIGAGDVAVFRPDGSGRMQLLRDRLGKPLAVDEQAAYVGFSGELRRLPLDGSAAVRLGDVSARALALVPGRVVFTDGSAIWVAAR